MKSQVTQRPYALIGAGPMGLVTARQLQRYGVPFHGFELHSGPGGLWDIDNPHSTMYESAHLISSKTMTELAEFPMREEVATYPHHRQVGQYFRDYAEHFKLNQEFNYQARVLTVKKVDDSFWRVHWRNEADGSEHIFEAGGVLIASGTLNHPLQPELPGNFTGTVIHAAEYRHAESFKDERVLVVGCGNSACDIAVDAVHHAKSVDLSVRRGYYFLPKFVLGKAIDTLGGKITLPRWLKQRIDGLIVKLLVGKPSQYGLPDPDYRLYESHPVMNSLILHHLGHGDIQARPAIKQCQGNTVEFSDGSRADYDKILFATGYKLHYPFIDASTLNWQGPAPNLYLNVFNPSEPNVLMLGMIEAAGLGWQGRAEQAELAALYLRAQQDKPSAVNEFRRTIAEAMAKDAHKMDGGMEYLKLDRMAYYVHKETYRATIKQHTRQLKQQLKA